MKAKQIIIIGILHGVMLGVTASVMEDKGYQAGYDQAKSLANWVIAPTTLEEAEAEKLACEEMTNETCWISGQFIPESMTIGGQQIEPTNDAELPGSI